MTVARPMKSGDDRFAYEAAGDPKKTPLVFLHGIGGAARGLAEPARILRRSLPRDCLGHAGLWRLAPLASVSIAALAEALRQFLRGSAAPEADAGRPFDRRHDRPAMAGQSSDRGRAVVLAQTSPAFGKPDGDWQKAFIEARLGPLDRGETMASLAPSLVSELVGDDPDPAGMELARDCMGGVPEASYRAIDAGADRFRPAPCAQGDQSADARAVRLEGQQRAGADDGENGELRSRRRLCRPRGRRASRQPRTARRIQCGARHASSARRIAVNTRRQHDDRTSQQTHGSRTRRGRRSTRRSSIPTRSGSSDEQAALIARARELGQACSPRAPRPTIATRASRPRTIATCIAPACSASASRKSMAGSARAIRPTRSPPPRSAAIAARPR